MHFERQPRILPVQAREHGRQVGHGDMLADAERQPVRAGRDRAQRVIVRVEQRAGGRQEILAVGGQLDDARRAREQRLAEVRFQPLQLQADGRLRGAERIGGAREAGEIGNQHERANGIEVKDFHF
ncbi:hypothetical protein BLA6863_00348 [Burkholderia lata]|uniref:Uncharacterized protein n=1 Tax=Burkholderia lata (strain ATCC 17760 / DSM 23089 / LMG 22485 / NCIMB 9086 / R18194 / 383) TaxID=482957 RepID=A0A6P2H2K3_BURL3|nr:hypothetical protein BLA6863_00348 [Burkholderia lata]